MKRLLKSSKINWRSSFYAPGFYLLLSWGCISVTFLILQTTTFVQRVVAVIFLLFFCFLLIYKFPQYRQLLVLFLGIISLITLLNQQTSETKIGEPIQIYSDQVKVSDQFFYGEGRIGKNKVLISGSINKSLEKELNRFGGCHLVNYKAKVVVCKIRKVTEIPPKLSNK